MLFCFVGLWYGFCLFSVVLYSKLGSYCRRVLFKFIVAERQQIPVGDLAKTQSCIVRDGFGAGLGQSDRHRKRERGKSKISTEVRICKDWELRVEEQIKCSRSMQSIWISGMMVNEWEGKHRESHQWQTLQYLWGHSYKQHNHNQDQMITIEQASERNCYFLQHTDKIDHVFFVYDVQLMIIATWITLCLNTNLEILN